MRLKVQKHSIFTMHHLNETKYIHYDGKDNNNNITSIGSPKAMWIKKKRTTDVKTKMQKKKTFWYNFRVFVYLLRKHM